MLTCSLCGLQEQSIETAIEAGWIPSYYDGDNERSFACECCSFIRLELSQDDFEFHAKTSPATA